MNASLWSNMSLYCSRWCHKKKSKQYKIKKISFFLYLSAKHSTICPVTECNRRERRQELVEQTMLCFVFQPAGCQNKQWTWAPASEIDEQLTGYEWYSNDPRTVGISARVLVDKQRLWEISKWLIAVPLKPVETDWEMAVWNPVKGVNENLSHIGSRWSRDTETS